MAAKIVEQFRNRNGELPTYAWPGGYPILYRTLDGGTLCGQCANSEDANDAAVGDAQWYITSYEVFYEGAPEVCDHCGTEVQSAYGEVD